MSAEPVITLAAHQPWATEITLTDAGREFRFEVGRAEGIHEPAAAVEIVQVEQIDWEADPGTVRREPPLIRTDGYRYSLNQAAALVDLIERARTILGEADR